MTNPTIQPRATQCFRCSYDLRGIADNQPCPECGLLAARSRYLTADLSDAHPRWLRNVLIGLILIVISFPICVVSRFELDLFVLEFFSTDWANTVWVRNSELLVASLIFGIGAFLVTSNQKYFPAGKASRRWRSALRASAIALLFAVNSDYWWGALTSANSWFGELASNSPALTSEILQAFGFLSVASAYLSLFMYLRIVAARARRTRIAKHCILIAGGSSALMTLTAVLPFIPDPLSQITRLSQDVAIGIGVDLFVFIPIFLVWSVCLLVIFVISFARARGVLRKKWMRDDHFGNLSPNGNSTTP